MERKDLPVGFAMALAMNPQAMQRFSTLDDQKKQQIIDGTHSLCSREEMHQYVNNLVSNNKTDTIV